MQITRRAFLKKGGVGVGVAFLPRWMVRAGDGKILLPADPPQVYLPNADVPWACRVERSRNPSPERFPFRSRIRVTRAADLLDLTFEWTNVEPVLSNPNEATRFIRKKPGTPAFLTVWFPAQHVLEHAYRDFDAPPEDLPAKDDLASAIWGGATRLVFAIPEIYEQQPLPYGLATLLNWQVLVPSLAQNALPPDYPATSRQEPRALKITETAIELPWGMLLSPDAGEEWHHKEPPPISKDFKSQAPTKVELWHTELIRKSRAELPLSVRAVWYGDALSDEAFPVIGDRRSIVHQTSDFNLRYSDEHKFLAKHIDVERLLLSSQGAYAKLKVGWTTKEIEKLHHPADAPMDILEWNHQCIWSRDQYNKVAKMGYCMPFGHVVSSVEEHRREFKDFKDGTAVAKLEKYVFCTVCQPVIEYKLPPNGVAGVARGCPYQRIEISPLKTPYLEKSPEETHGWMVVKGGKEGNDADIFQFTITAWDWDGNRSQFQLPLAWILKDPAETGTNLNPLVETYKARVSLRRAALSGQKVAFAPSDVNASRDVGVETSSILFYVDRREELFPRDWVPRFYPQVDSDLKAESAIIRLAQTAAFDTSGAGGRSILRYNKLYFEKGFRHTDDKGTVVNGTEVFANIEKEVKSIVPSLNFPGEKSGGLTTPSLDNIANLSRIFGPVGGPMQEPDKAAVASDSSFVLGGKFDPEAFLGAAAKLIGGVKLAEVIEEVEKAYDEIARVPKLVAETIGEIQGKVEEVRKMVDEIRKALDALNALRTGGLKALYSEIRQHVIELVEREAEKMRTKVTGLILQEIRDYEVAIGALKTAALVGFGRILTDRIDFAAGKFAEFFRNLGDGADPLVRRPADLAPDARAITDKANVLFPFIFTTLRDAQRLNHVVEEALKTVDAYMKLGPALQQQVIERIGNYLRSPEFSAALGVGEFQKQFDHLRDEVLGLVTDAVLKVVDVKVVPKETVELAIKHPEVMAELVVAWDDPTYVEKRILEKVETTLAHLEKKIRDVISKEVTKCFTELDPKTKIKTILGKYNTSLLQFRDYIFAELSRSKLAEDDAKAQLKLIGRILDPFKFRNAFEKAIGSFDGVLAPIRELPLGPLKNIIEDFNRLREEFKEPGKNLLNGELNRTLKQLGDEIDALLKPGLANNFKTVLAQTSNILGDTARVRLKKEVGETFEITENDRKAIHEDVRKRVVDFVADKRTKLEDLATTYADAVANLSKGWLDESKGLLRELAAAAGMVAKPLQQIVDAVRLVQKLAREAAEEIPKELAVDYAWEPKLKSSGAFEARRNGVPATFKLQARIRKSLRPGDLGKPPAVRVDGKLRDFALRLLPSPCFIIVAFKEISFLSENGSKPDVTVRIDRVAFGEALKFVQELAKALSPDSGFFIQLSGASLEAGYRFALPAITSGGFNLVQVSINTAVVLPFDGSEVRVKFSLSDRMRPFLLSVGILGGGGFFGITLSAKGVETLEGSLEFGAIVALDICVASGRVSVTAGIYFCQSGNNASLYGFVRAEGALRVISLITVSITFYLGVGYEKRDGNTLAVGEAIVTVEVEMFFFSASVNLRYRKEFEGSSDGGERSLQKNAELRGSHSRAGGLSERAREYLAFKKNWRKYRSCFFRWRDANSEELAL